VVSTIFAKSHTLKTHEATSGNTNNCELQQSLISFYENIYLYILMDHGCNAFLILKMFLFSFCSHFNYQNRGFSLMLLPQSTRHDICANTLLGRIRKQPEYFLPIKIFQDLT